MTSSNYITLTKLLAEQKLEGPEAGVTKIVLEHGVEKLSEKQRDVFEKYVVARHLDRHCDRCGEEVPLEEVVDFDGMCNTCKGRQT